jgi:hypothetical protein
VIKQIGRSLAVMLIGLLPIMGLGLYDLHQLGDKPSWNNFDQARAKGYLLAGSIIGMVAPLIGPLRFINVFASHGYHFATNSLPDERGLDTFRDILTNDQFCTELEEFDAALKSGFTDANKSWVTKRIIQRVFFGQGSSSLFDDWAVVIAGTSHGGSTQISYFVWGMGIVPDERAPEFFGHQLGKLSFLFPLKWSNRLEEYGLAEGYWVLLTESDATSGFSYEARRQNSAQRIRNFVTETQILHASNKGKSLKSICGEHL